MPIGNLTSQIFANFYLNRLDKYVTEDLQIKYYGRYVDDFVLIHEDKQVLLAAWKKIGAFFADAAEAEFASAKVLSSALQQRR